MEGNSVFFKGHVGMYRLFGFTGTSAFHLGTLEHEFFQYVYVNQDALEVGNLYKYDQYIPPSAGNSAGAVVSL